MLIPKSTKWQNHCHFGPQIEVRFPADDYKIQFADLLNFILGEQSLKQVPVEIRLDGSLVIPFKLDLPDLGPILQGIWNGRCFYRNSRNMITRPFQVSGII